MIRLTALICVLLGGTWAAPGIASNLDAACANGQPPNAGYRVDTVAQLISSSTLTFYMFTDGQGCDQLNITCAGYGYIEIIAFNTHGQATYIDSTGINGLTSLFISVQLSWQAAGWGAGTSDMAPINNTFYCMVTSTTPITTTIVPPTIPSRPPTTTIFSAPPPTTTKRATTQTVPPSATTPKKPVVTTQKAAPTTTAGGPTTPAPDNGPGCVCNFSTTWNDVMFVLDNSQSMGIEHLDEVWGFIQTTFGFANIQPASCGTCGNPMNTRIGVVTYSDNATLRYKLGQLDYNGFMDVDELPYTGRLGTNLAQALDLAAAEFAGSNHRSNVRKIVVVFPSTYTNGDYHTPTVSANAFKNSGGVLVVYDYLNMFKDTGYASIASPGYFISDDEDGSKIQQAMCDANCFCPLQYTPYGTSSTRNLPSSGCYDPVTAVANNQIANNKCSRFAQGYLAEGKSKEKSSFLASLFSKQTNFWVGLKYNKTSSDWRWIDGTPLSSSYQPWCSGGSTYTGSDCVYVTTQCGSDLSWVKTDCRNGYEYICEAPPCDSVNYCAESL